MVTLVVKMVVTLDIYADVGPDAKRAAVDKVADSFDVDLDSLYDFPSPGAAPSTSAGALTFSVDQLKAMLKPISNHTFCRGVFRYLTKDGRALAADYLNLDVPEREGGMLLLSMRWYPVPGQDAPAGPENLPIARRCDGLCVVVADSVVVKQKPWPAKTGRGFCLATETIFLRRPTRLRSGLQLGRFARLLHRRLALQVLLTAWLGLFVPMPCDSVRSLSSMTRLPP